MRSVSSVMFSAWASSMPAELIPRWLLNPATPPNRRFAYRLAGAIGKHAIDVEAAIADHEVDVNHAAIAAGGGERLVGHRFAALHREAVGGAERDVAGGVLIEQRVVEETTGLRDR